MREKKPSKKAVSFLKTKKKKGKKKTGGEKQTGENAAGRGEKTEKGAFAS